MSKKKEHPVPGAGYVDYVPALVQPEEASTEAGTEEAGTETSIYQGLRGVALVEEDKRRNSFAHKAVVFLLCLLGGAVVSLPIIALLVH